MTIQHLIFRMGAGDTVAVPAVADAEETEIDLVGLDGRLDYGLGDALDSLASQGLRAPEVAIDLLVIAGAITAADTRVSRETQAQDAWTRELSLSVPVSDVPRWSAQSELLGRTLRFLTGDLWSFEFRPRPKSFKSLARQPELLAIKPTCTCLLSGGLDSFIGAIDLLEKGEKPLFISHYWDPDTSVHQGVCLERIAKQYPKVPKMTLRCRIGFPSDLVVHSGSENTLRGRSFLFFAMAALAASSAKVQTVIVPENGLISLNVPLDPLRLGALSTRTTHPYYMARWNELLHSLSLDVKLVNPYRFQTKGAMVAACANQLFLGKFAHETMSCSHPASGRFKGESPGHCGRCVPCVIRRAALTTGPSAGTLFLRAKPPRFTRRFAV
jgi:hypothetical protein